jgi:hypothetical protein
MPDVPVRVALRLVLAALSQARQEASDRLTRNPKGNPTGTHAVRLRERIGTINEQHYDVLRLLRSEPKGTLRADIAGLLAAYALGHLEALSQLEALLASIRLPQAEAVADCDSQDIAGVCRLLTGGS